MTVLPHLDWGGMIDGFWDGMGLVGFNGGGVAPDGSEAWEWLVIGGVPLTSCCKKKYYIPGQSIDFFHDKVTQTNRWSVFFVPS